MLNAAVSSKRYLEATPRDWAKSILAIGLAVAAGWACTRLDLADQRTAAATSASIAATMLGFILAVVSILLAMNDRVLIQNMRKTGHFEILVTEFANSALVFTVSLLASLAAILLPAQTLVWPAAIGVGFFGAGTVLFLFAARKLQNVVLIANRSSVPKERETQGE